MHIGGHILQWHRPMRESIPHLQDAIRISEMFNSTTFGAYAWVNYTHVSFLVGASTIQLQHLVDRGVSFCSSIGATVVSDVIQSMAMIIEAARFIPDPVCF